MDILNDSGVVFFGPRSQPKAVRWWADRGQLHWEDSRDNTYGVVSIREFLMRLKAINDMLANGKRVENKNFLHWDEVERQTRFVEQALELVKKAKQQGDPHNPDVLTQQRHERTLPVAMPQELATVDWSSSRNLGE